MKSRTLAIEELFEEHGPSAIYVVSTGYLSRAVHALRPTDPNVFYMKGSMGLAPAIGLGISLNSDADVIVLSGDASLLMHLGITHTIRDFARDNLYLYVLDNGCHESVGGHPCVSLESAYPGVQKIISINKEGKTPRVKIGFRENADQLKKILAQPLT